MGNMMCFSHSGVVEVLGALDVFPVVPGGAEHFEVPDAFEHVATSMASIVCVAFPPRNIVSVHTAGNVLFPAYLG